tara:strand:- start:75 stop:641 length:567 start_codon:yes stop_codon:yes gene_type:complete
MKTNISNKQLKNLASNDCLKPSLRGVFLNTEKNELCATDGHILGRYKVDVSETDHNAILPLSAFDYKTGRKGYTATEYAINGSVKRTVVNNTTGQNEKAEFPLVEERFPDYEAVLPSETPTFEIGVDLKKLQKIASAMPTKDKKVKLSFTTATSAIRIEPIHHTKEEMKNNGDQFSFIVMPIRLKETV